MTIFFLKSKKDAEGKDRVRVYVEQDNGFVGLAEESTFKSLSKDYGRFYAKLQAYGEDKAQEICRKHGEFRFIDTERSLKTVERDIVRTQEKLEQLESEYKESKARGIKESKANKDGEKT